MPILLDIKQLDSKILNFESDVTKKHQNQKNKRLPFHVSLWLSVSVSVSVAVCLCGCLSLWLSVSVAVPIFFRS